MDLLVFSLLLNVLFTIVIVKQHYMGIDDEDKNVIPDGWPVYIVIVNENIIGTYTHKNAADIHVQKHFRLYGTKPTVKISLVSTATGGDGFDNNIRGFFF